jgi:DNA repair exonuclease SbcCD ATPase subunit
MIRTLTITGFRGISEEIPFTLGAITLLSGRNGLGKTTLFDAIDWCLFGASWRLGFDKGSVRNIYHPNLNPVVRMEMLVEGKTLLIERTNASAFLDGSRISDRNLVEALMIDPEGIAPYTRDVESRLRRVVYLSQEDIRALVHPDNATERVSLYQALLGVPNASVVQSGVRRIGDRFRQREQELRLHLGQLRLRKDELIADLESTTNETIDSARVISEASRTLNAPSSLSVEELAQRSRQEMDKLSAESIQLDEALSAITVFRKRRKADAALAEQLSQQIQVCASEEATAAASDEKALLDLAAARQASEESNRALNAALALQESLLERAAAQRRIDELNIEQEEAKTTLRISEEVVLHLRTDLERLRGASDAALNRRHDTVAKRSELEAARDRMQSLRERRREEEELLLRVGSVTGAIEEQLLKRERLKLQLQEAREEMNRRQEEFESLKERASSSNELESLLRQAVTLLPPDLSQCPLCGSSFGSRQELILHIARVREENTFASNTLSQSQTASRAQQGIVEDLETEARKVGAELAQMEREKSQFDISLQRVREMISTIPTQIEAPAEGDLEVLDEELKSIDEELRTLRNEIDDRSTRLHMAQDDLSRAFARQEAATQRLDLARQGGGSNEVPKDREQQVASATGAVNTARITANEAADTEKAAAQLRSTKQLSLQSVNRRLADLRSELNAVRERSDAETSTLLRQLVEQLQGQFSIDEAAAQVQERRTKVSDRLVEMRRIWSELVVAGTEERSKSIRIQSDAVERELIATQRSLDGLLSAQTRFTKIADELRKTAESEAAGALQHQRQAIQECFAAIYPHGHLNKVVMGDDPLGEVLVTDELLAKGVEPTTYLSTGQSNVLALSIFLGIALRQRLLKVGIVCLDEPVQHLDDLHFLGFVSLLKRVGLARQVVMSTADANVAEIITRQMQSSWAERPSDFTRYDWHSFDPKTGPSVGVWSSARRAVA